MTIQTTATSPREEKARSYLKTLGYCSCFYFGFRIFLMLAMSAGMLSAMSVFSYAFNILLLMFGLIASIYLIKLRKWALISICALVGLHIVSLAVNMNTLRGFSSSLLVQISIFALQVKGLFEFKHLKKPAGEESK
jgi:hypothetical protein